MHERGEIPAGNIPPAQVAEPLGAMVLDAAGETPAQPPHRVRAPKPHKPARKSSVAREEVDDLEEVSQEELNAEATGSADLARVYMNEIGKVALLNAEEEVELAKDIETGLFAETILKYRDGGDEEHAEIRQSILKGVAVRLKAEAERTQKANGQQKPKTAKERAEAKRQAALEWEKQAAVETDASMVAIERLAESKELTTRELKALIVEGKRAKEHLEKANLRLVVSLAKRYTGNGMPFLDLIQEGNLGVIRAVEKFDYTKGFKFSTYATWWIRQAITRSMADQARTIRLPVHMAEVVSKLRRVRRELLKDLSREPTPGELAEELNITPEKVLEIQQLTWEPASLDQGVGEDEHDAALGDFLADEYAPDAFEAVVQAQRNEKLAAVLATLDEREQVVIKMRYGIGYPAPMTLDEIAREFGLSRERIRQIENGVMTKLRHPSRKDPLRDYLD